MNFIRLIILLPVCLLGSLSIRLGVDELFETGHLAALKGKSIGLITNQTGVDKDLEPTIARFLDKKHNLRIKALFCPEHGLSGAAYAFEKIKSDLSRAIPLYSLHGETRRPTEEMLKGIDLLVYDIQDIGVRSYTFASTLFYVMEEAAKRKIPVIVLDRPNPLGGELIDGPLLETPFRSFVGYVDVPYCHGMTIGELAHYFNAEYKIGCALKVIPMKGWRRSMTFEKTGLHWIPTSPHIPEADSPLFCASTGLIGELGIVSIGVGYTLPFKVVGAPWIDAETYANALNKLKLPGVAFRPFHFKPFYGLFKGKTCNGVLIVVKDKRTYKPLSAQFALLGILKSLYPSSFKKSLEKMSKSRRALFCKTLGTDRVLKLLESEPYVTYKLLELDQNKIAAFGEKRKKYLLYP